MKENVVCATQDRLFPKRLLAVFEKFRLDTLHKLSHRKKDNICNCDTNATAPLCLTEFKQSRKYTKVKHLTSLQLLDVAWRNQNNCGK